MESRLREYCIIVSFSPLLWIPPSEKLTLTETGRDEVQNRHHLYVRKRGKDLIF